MNRTRLQQLAGLRPLHEADNSEMYMQWEDEMKEQFIEQNPNVTDDPEELEVEPNGQVYHRESNQRWPEGTVTPFDDWQADEQSTKAGAQEDFGKEQQERAVASGKTRAVASRLADQFIDETRRGSQDHEQHKKNIKELMKAVHEELASKGF